MRDGGNCGRVSAAFEHLESRYTSRSSEAGANGAHLGPDIVLLTILMRDIMGKYRNNACTPRGATSVTPCVPLHLRSD